MNYNILTYISYLLLTLYIVLYVGAVLFRRGRAFLVNTFKGDENTADSLNKVLLAGYYLVNAGYTIMALKVWETVGSFRETVEVLSIKAGVIILTLGVMHLFNVITLIIIGRRNKQININ
ncbi:MAG TPA: hypothetical protein VF868_02680 [Bacteroidia bacterium]|jgi:hypothetical protein